MVRFGGDGEFTGVLRKSGEATDKREESCYCFFHAGVNVTSQVDLIKKTLLNFKTSI